jgi:hypothetical protein
MRLFSLRLLSLLVVSLFATAVFAHDITITGTQNFSSLDGSSADHDGVVNGVFTVSDGNLVVNGVVNCNDDTTTSACPMSFVVSGNMTINSGGALYAENRSGSGTGAAITLTVGGNLALNGTAIVSTASKSSSGSTGGAITANVSGSVALASGTTIDSGAANATGGSITIAAGNVISVDGNVLSGPSRTILSTRLTDVALDGGTGNTVGGAITIGSSTFVEPALSVGATANIISQGSDGGAGPVKLDACGIQIKGLVAALSSKDGAAQVSIRSGKDVLIDGRDLGGSGTRMGRVRADSEPSGTAVHKGVDIFAGETIDLFGPSGSLFVITSHPGQHDSKSYGGLIRITSLGEGVNASGNVVDTGRTASGDTGGTVQVAAKGDVNLNTAVLRAIGDSSTGNPNRGGGSISVRSYSGNVIWTNGTGDVRPVGSSSGLAPADQGSITLTACGTISTTGSTFPSNGTPTSPLPDTHTGSCSPAAPSLPSGVPPLVTCNTPPVANDTAATTNEDTAVTITMTGSDADGDSLTFTIVSGPSHGTLGPVVFVNATTSTVNYTPALNYNGPDSFVFRANDGNGGTDDATATITVNPVNDPPSFQIGPTVTVLEDSGAQTVSPWVTAISPGPADESAQTVTFTTTNNNNALFSVQPFVASNGTLTFTPASNAYGSATITVFAQDNGGIANGGNDTSASQTSTITVTGVNDEPSFVKGADQNVNEDAGPQTVSPWATSISAGPANESGQTLTFVTSNNNNALFSAQPSVSSSGTLTYTPAADAFGTATVTIYLMDNGGTANGGDDTSPSQTFTITVNSVNDAPSFTSGGNVTVNEDSGAYSAAWATAISAGPANESSQTVSFNTSNNNNSLFSAQPSISSTGVLTFTVAADANGTATVTVTAQDDGGTANGGVDTSAPQTFTITVNSVNDEPSFVKGSDQTVNEDAGAQTVPLWATSISAGPANESGQTLTFVTSNDNNALFSAQPSVSSSGTLTYTPAANAFGTATVTIYLMDNGGGDDTSPSQTFVITVNSVNDAPSFTGGGNVTVNEDSGAYSAAWATAISAGPANESSQTVTFVVSNDNTALFSVQPSVSSSGVLTFTPAADAFGTATVTIYAKDNGGTANGGVDQSPSQTFMIVINAVNDAPSFTPGGDVTVNEDSGLYSATWATAISAGPPNESGQTLTFVVNNSNNALFSVQPSISSTGVLTFSPASNASGSATVTVYLMDNGGTANGGVNVSGTVTFNITVNAVNDPPVVNNESYETIGNTMLEVSSSQTQTPAVFVSGSVLSNDSDSDGPNPLTASLGTASAGAVVVVNSDGTFTYVPPAGFTGGTDSFTYNVSDGASMTTGTVTITVKSRVWYVRNNTGGTSGRSHDPFATLAAAEAAATPGDTIYVFTGDGTTSGQNSGFTMSSNQRLLGAGVQLDVPVSVNGGPNPTVLLAAGSRPSIGNSAGSGVTAQNVSGVEIAGLNVSASSSGVSIATTAGSGSANVHDMGVTSAATEGFDIDGGGAAGLLTVMVNNVSVVSTGNGFDARSSAGEVRVALDGSTMTSTGGTGVFLNTGVGTTFVVTSLLNDVVTGNTGGNGIVATGVRFDAIPGGTLDTINGGTLSIGSAGNGVGGSGLSLSSVTGHLSLSNLNVVADGPVGILLSGTGAFTGAAGTQLSATTGSVSATAGAGITASNATLAMSLASLNSANSGTTGLSLSSIGGSLTAATGAISNATNADISISSSSANVSYGGTITDDVGQLVTISNSSGTMAFSGAITDLNNGSGAGISLTNNAGATITFSGGITLSTGTNAAFAATGGGTVNVTGTNKVTTTTGTAVNIATPTNIGGSGVTFESVNVNNGASSSAVNAIVLNGTTGSFTVTGDGSQTGGFYDRDGSGGTIDRTTGHSIVLTNASNVTLRKMNITNTAASFDGINSTGGSNVVLSAMNFDTLGRNGWSALNIGGVNRVDNNSRFFGWNATNANAVGVDQNVNFTSFTVDRSLFTTSATGADAFLFDGNAGSGTVNVTNSEFTLIDQDAVQINDDGSGNITAVVQSNNFHDADNTAGDGNNTLFLANSGSGTLNFTIGGPTAADGNTFNNLGRLVVLAGVVQVNATTVSKTGTRIVGTVQNNTISNSTGRRAIDFGIEANGGAHGGHDITVNNNIVSNVRKQGVNIVLTSLNAGDVTGNKFRILNNTLTNVGTEGNTDSGSGIEFENNSANAGGDFTSDVLIQGNVVSNNSSSTTGTTLEVNARDLFAGDTDTVNLTIWGNDLTNSNASGEVLEILNTGTAGNQTLCLDMNGANLAANANKYTGGGAAGFKVTNNFGTFNIGGMAAGAQSFGAVQTFLSPRNNNQTVTAAGAVGNFSGSPGGCTLP